MDSIFNLLKGLVAIGIVAMLVFFGLTVFAFLLGVACIAGLIFWVKRKIAMTSSPVATHQSDELHHSHTASTTIIEGEAEEVTKEH